MQELPWTLLAMIRRLVWLISGGDFVVSRWDMFLVVVVHLTVFGLLFRTYFGPFLLRVISKRVRVRSISLRSIRGVYLRTGAITCRVDRIGLAYHSSTESARRFSVKIEGLSIELYQLCRKYPPSAGPVPLTAENRDTRISTFADFSPSPLAHKLWSFYSAIYASVEPFGRPILRTFFVTTLRILIRSLPALTQVIDFELERCLITFAKDQDIHFTIQNASLLTTVNFSSLGIILEPNGGDLRARDDRHGFFSMAQLRGRLNGSLKRVWNRAWGQAKGSASFELRIRNIGCQFDIPKNPQLKRPQTNMTESSQNIAASCFDYVAHPNNSKHQCIGIPGITELKGFFEFGPRKGIIEKQSVGISLRIKTVHISVDKILSLLESLQGTTCLVSGRNNIVVEPESSAVTTPPDTSTLGSPIYTRLTTSMPFRPWGQGSTAQKKKPSSLIPLVRSLECSIGDMRVFFNIGKPLNPNRKTYTGHTRGLSLSVKLCDHGKDTLQQEFLGSRSYVDSNRDADVLSFSALMKEIIIDRRDAVDKSPLVRVIFVGPVELSGFMTQWSLLSLPSPSLLRGDPNASLLVASLSISSPQLSERMDVLMQVLEDIRRPSESPLTPRPARKTLSFIPRIRLDISVNDVAACLIPVNADSEPSSSVILSSTQCVMSLCSNYNYFPLQGRNQSTLDGEASIAVEKVFSFNSILGPAFVTSLPKPFSLDTSNRVSKVDTPSGFGDPLLSVSAFELSLEGQTLGTLYDEEYLVVLDLPSTILDLSCVTDAISVELWQPSAIVSLTHLLSFTERLSGDKKTNADGGTGGFTFDVQAHFAVGQLGIIVTGKDLNPEEDGSLSRGIALRSGLAIQYCSLPSRGNVARLRRRHAQPHARQQLYLSDELITDAFSLSNRVQPEGERVALFRFVVWNAAIRSAVATDFAADHSYETAEEVDELRSTEFLWFTRLEIDAFLTSIRGVSAEERRLQVSLKVPYLHTRLQLADAYCFMLALSTLNSLSASTRSQTTKTEQISPKTAVSFKGSIDVCQALIRLPLREQLSFRINGLRIRKSVDDPISFDFASILVWAPLSNLDGRWEEIIRLRTWRVTLNISPTEPLALVLDGEGAQFRIPHTYVLADLILDLNVSVKCLKYLFSTISSEASTISPIPDPSAEAAKVVPIISLKIGSFSLEAADDPFESKLGLALRAGLDATRSRLERDDAFATKVAAIQTAEIGQGNAPNGRFTPKHTVSVDEARVRLMQVHAISWTSVHREYRDEQRRKEDTLRRRMPGEQIRFLHDDIKPLVPVSPIPKYPPLLRIIFNRFCLGVTQPLFSPCDLPEFLHDLGNGLPYNTKFSLLVPMHLNLSLGATRVTLRDYPLPLLDIPQGLSDTAVAWAIDTDLVIAEEMGDSSCVIWKDCPVLSAGVTGAGTKALNLLVPKTTMSVKTYAKPCVSILTTRTTEFCWGVSYNAALQDVMRIIDTLSSPPPDPSPNIGFWDKMRLILHWEVKVTFCSEVHLNLKGSRDPYCTTGAGAGFTFCWLSNTELTIGVENRDKELLQVISDTMLIVIPDFTKASDGIDGEPSMSRSHSTPNANAKPGTDDLQGRYRKICAKFTSGIRWGIGFILERTCGVDCPQCIGTFACRMFDFKPHYEIQLRPRPTVPQEKTPDDSFNGFRSDFIHLSTSLTSSVRHRKTSSPVTSNSFHLSPKTFAHFWAWWDLFDRFLSIPIRQGKQFTNTRTPSKKFGKHLATLKYRLSVSQLFISHVYMDESRDCWNSGTSKLVGIKALVDTFEADMHQREQEAIVPDILPGTTKKIRHKPFYAAEVKLAGLQLRGISATFPEPLRCLIDVGESRNDFKDEYTSIPDGERPPSHWLDMNDFVETDWRTPNCEPLLRMPQIASCPRFTYFRRSSGHHHDTESSRFGNEDTHACLMGQEPSVHRTQSAIFSQRLSVLKVNLSRLMALSSDTSLVEADSIKSSRDTDISNRITELERKINQLERYIIQLRESDDQNTPESKGDLASYLMPSDISCPGDWTEFDNVYQFHCPKFTLENSIRDILMQYYYCSRSRKGFEYHMATRAVKFIRDQANILSLSRLSTDTQERDKRGRNATGSAAQAAAQAIRKILVGDDEVPTVINTAGIDEASVFDPIEGWSDGVSLEKSHFCLLLKPQVVLRSDVSTDSICILAAVQATLQSFAILDTENAEDPISGRVMTRSHAVLSGLQTFSPSKSCRMAYDSVPPEVLIDLRAESSDFDRLVPQTNATFRYDKFNRLRLRNNVNSAVASSSDQANGHLQHQTDLIDVRVPRFTVSADSNNFRAIANVITNLLLQSNSAHKHHLNQVETLLFSYDFTDLFSAADVVEGLQLRLRRAVEQERNFETCLANDDETKLEMLKIKAHVFLLTEELNLIFDAIKLAQDKADDKQNDQKSALKVHASSREISWGMVDDVRDIIVKLAMKELDFSWLNRQDGSTVNNLMIGDVQAFDGCLDAEWPEILAKHREPSSHPLVKRGIFVQADWTVLAPVGGITIYERFNVDLHPMRLQLEARVGKSIMEYIFPARRERLTMESTSAPTSRVQVDKDDVFGPQTLAAARSDTGVFEQAHHDTLLRPRGGNRYSVDERRPTLSPATKRITSSRSFTDLRLITRQSSTSASTQLTSDLPFLDKDVFTEAPVDIQEHGKVTISSLATQKQPRDDAAEMKSRSSQKTFILVRIASLHLLLSFRKDGSFFCRDARIETRELQYRNRTLSFEELAEQFIPSDPTWRGWMRIALHQPLVPVLPVARELLSKTKWIATKGKVARQAKKIGQAARTSTTRLRGSSESGGSPSTSRVQSSDLDSMPQGDVNAVTMSPKSKKSGQSKHSTGSR